VVSSATVKDILWRLPLSLVGHLYAKALKYNGVKGIERPKKYKNALAELKKQMESQNVRN